MSTRVLEANLAGRDLPDSLRTVCLVHRAPVRLPSRMKAGGEGLRAAAIVDAVAFDETAIVSGLRGGARDVALTLAHPERLGLPESLMAMRREPDGRLAFRGQACAVAPLQRGIPAPGLAEGLAEPWHPTPYEPVLASGIVTALTAWEGRADAPNMNFFATA